MPADRLAARTLELVDIASESRDEARLAAHVLAVLGDAGVPVRDGGDTCILAGPIDSARVVLAGHLDTVPAQGNRPGRREPGVVHGLGACDMKGALAVMIELALARMPFGFVFFGREELPVAESALTPLLEREPVLRAAGLAIVMEPTANRLQAGCLGNIVARLHAHGTSGHSARPWLADNAIHRLADGIAAVASHPYEEHVFEGLAFTEAMSVTSVSGGMAINVIPDEAQAGVNFRYSPGRSPAEAEAILREVCGPFGDVEIVSNAPSGAVASGNELLALLREEDLGWEPKQAWTPVAEFSAVGVDAVNFGPGDPRFAHRRDEQVADEALERCYEVLERLACR